MTRCNKEHMTHTKRPRGFPSPYRLFAGPAGRKVAMVEATGGGSFQLNADDWQTIRGAFGIVTAYVNDDGKGHLYVVGYHRPTGRKVPLARLLAQPGRGQRVTYQDGNGLNLRRENLTVSGGYSKVPAPDGLLKAA